MVSVRVMHGDCRELLATLPAGSAQCCVTSPPYFGLRDYGEAAQIGLEPTPDAYVAELVAVFRQVRRVLADDGVMWLNLGDSYNNIRSQMGPWQAVHGRDKLNGKPEVNTRKRGWPDLKEKDLIGIPWLVAFALRADGWYLRSDVIWHKPNPMPESVTDRPTKAHEYLFLLSKSSRYFYDAGAIAEPSVSDHPSGNGFARPAQISRGGRGSSEQWIGMGGSRNSRSVWTIATQPFDGAHFATMPPALVERCVLAGSRPGDTVLDPFGGAGTTGMVADRLGRDAVLCELNTEYAAMAERRIARDRLDRGSGTMADVAAARMPPTPLEAFLASAEA